MQRHERTVFVTTRAVIVAAAFSGTLASGCREPELLLPPPKVGKSNAATASAVTEAPTTIDLPSTAGADGGWAWRTYSRWDHHLANVERSRMAKVHATQERSSGPAQSSLRAEKWTEVTVTKPLGR